MNSAVLVGRLTEDPRTGEKATRIRVAVDRRKKEDGADYINCVAFGKTAELIGKYLKKGSRVGITGRINTGSYNDKNGNKVYTTDVIVETLEFLDSKQKEANDGFDDYGLGFN